MQGKNIVKRLFIEKVVDYANNSNKPVIRGVGKKGETFVTGIPKHKIRKETWEFVFGGATSKHVIEDTKEKFIAIIFMKEDVDG